MFNFDEFRLNKTTFPNIYLGVVEDALDPIKSGRVKVRIIGIHTDKKDNTESEGIPTDHLPWAIPALPTFEGGTNGLGIFSVPVQGSMVAIFFIGGDHNYPVYFASIAAYPKTKPDSSKGFSDPDGKYPIYTGEPDWNRNARNSGELIKTKKDNAKTSGVSQFKTGSWDEPSSPYAAEYPYNTVIETRDNGVVIELDSTSGAERYHIYHKKSGNYFEISGDGQTVLKSNNNNYEINIKGKNILIKETKNESVGESADTRIEDDNNKYVGGSEETTINGSKLENINGKLSITVVGECNITATTINLDGSAGAMSLDGVVNGQCMCAFTGGPHPDRSLTVKATK